MMEMRSRVAIAGIGVVAALAAGCTPTGLPTATPTASITEAPASPSTPRTSSPTSSQPVSPTASSTRNASQQAAAAAVTNYLEVLLTIGHDPSGFSKTQMIKRLSQYLSADIVAAHVDMFMALKEKGRRWEGDLAIRSLVTSRVSERASVGLEVRVTVCQDQSTVKVVSKSGTPVAGEEFAPFNLRQYKVRQSKDSSPWRIVSMETVKGDCGS